MGQAQLDITMASQDLNQLVNLTMTTFPDAETVLLEGNVSDLVRERVIELRVEIPQSALSALSLSEDGDQLTLVNEVGEPTDYTVESYGVQTAIEDRYEIHSGVYSDHNDTRYDFVASTDPVPVTVIVIAIGAATCLLVIGLEALIDDCKGNQAANIQACAAAGGLPSLRANVIFGFGTDDAGHWRIGCSHTCSVECRR